MVSCTVLPDVTVIRIVLILVVWSRACNGQLQEFVNMHALGGVRELSAVNEAMCLASCQARTWCLAFDFDLKDASCWLHSRSSACQPLSTRATTRHVKIIQCFPSMHSLGGTRVTGVKDVADCLSRCSGGCVAVDFRDEPAACWLHSIASCGPLIPNQKATHFRFSNCESAGDTVSERLYNRHLVGGHYLPGVHTWQDCVRMCSGNCHSVDFDGTDNTCWHHYGELACNSATAVRAMVTHYRLASCRPLIKPSLTPRSPGLTCGSPNVSPSGSRIIGGDEARAHSFPWQVALRNRNARSSRCAATFVAPQWLLTTAHCVDQDLVPANWLALSGAHDLLDIENERIAHPISKVIIHEGFDLNTFDNDIALLKLTEPVSWSNVRSPICLPPQDYEIPGGTQCVITGWGVAANGRRPLKQAGIPVVPMSTCRRPDWLGSEFTLTERMICAGYEHGGVDTCQGDSGGPLICYINNYWVQVGVTSFGRGCGLPRKPGVYSKVSRFVMWIQAIISRF